MTESSDPTSATHTSGHKEHMKNADDKTTAAIESEENSDKTSATEVPGTLDETSATEMTESSDPTSATHTRPIMNQPRQTDLLLVGKTGNGKSATGNSILWRKSEEPFVSSSSTTSVTTVISAEVTEYKGRKIKVVDGPGLGDTRVEGLKIVQEGLQNAIYRNTKGFHAFLLVVRFGGRFTKEDIDAVELLKGYFGGPTFLKNYCILVLTCGDNFEYESKRSGQTFKQWCDGQKGILKKIIEECNGRVILFNNRVEEEAKKTEQLDELLKAVDSLPTNGVRYCDKQFELAKEGREKAIVNQQNPQINEEMVEETSLILEKFEDIQKIEDPKQRLDLFKELEKRADDLYKKIKLKDNQTGALREILEAAQRLKQTVHGESEICKEMITAEQKKKKEIEEIKKQEEQKSKKEIEEIKKQEEQKSKKEIEEIKTQEKQQSKKEIEEIKKQEEQKSKKEIEEIKRKEELIRTQMESNHATTIKNVHAQLSAARAKVDKDAANQSKKSPSGWRCSIL